jgi:hypothetical protein
VSVERLYGLERTRSSGPCGGHYLAQHALQVASVHLEKARASDRYAVTSSTICRLVQASLVIMPGLLFLEDSY